jgi:hypothetical protein
MQINSLDLVQTLKKIKETNELNAFSKKLRPQKEKPIEKKDIPETKEKGQ